MTDTVAVLFVCMGNICRSPTAEGLFGACVKRAGLAHCFELDSAGTIDYHTGEAPDHRAVAAASDRGVDISYLKARAVTASDFAHFDYILAMDNANLAELHRFDHHSHPNLRLLLSYADNLSVREVPDPYYGSEEGFNTVISLIEAACEGLLEEIKQKHCLK